MKLSDNFTLQEFINSSKAKELNISNVPTQIEIAALQSLCDNILEPIRAYFKLPVKILSGFRSKELNMALIPPGALNSQHLIGEAADITISGVKNVDIWKFIVDKLNYDQVIAEKLKKDNGAAGWVHVSHKRIGKQRNEALSFLGHGNYVKGLQYYI